MVERRQKEQKIRRRRGRKSTEEVREQSDDSRKSNKNNFRTKRERGASSSSNQQLQNSLLIELDDETPSWYSYGQKYPGRNATISSVESGGGQQKQDRKQNTKNTREMVARYRSLGDDIYQREIQLFKTSSAGASSDEKWVESTIKRGTLKDRIAAISVVVNTDPIHKFQNLDGLMSMASGPSSTNARVAQLAAEALEDLFVNTFLPPDRKMLTLAQRPLYLYEHCDDDQVSPSPSNKEKNKKNKTTKKTLSPRILLLWRFEEMVKEKYHQFLRDHLVSTLREGLEVQKIAALRTATILLRSVPEGENVLLDMTVNKLGDPTKKVAAAAGYELRKVLRQHPAMLNVVAREVQQLAHRPHLSSSALYHCIVFLNQLQLVPPEANGKENSNGSKETTGTSQAVSLPASLIKTYFRLFEVVVGQKKRKGKAKKTDTTTCAGGMNSRLLSALLTGVNRAHPFLPAKDQSMDEHVDALYRVVHTAPPAACTQALLLLFHLTVGSQLAGADGEKNGKKQISSNQQLSPERAQQRERFYRAVYSTLSQPEQIGKGRHLTMFFNLLYKTMKYDPDSSRVVAFCKRIFCTTIHCPANVVASCLFLFNEITKYHPLLLSCFQELLSGPDALRTLDFTKRDPRFALVLPDQSKKEDDQLDDGEQVNEKRAAMWELSLTLHHYHPSINKFSSDMGEINYGGDPLQDFGLTPFLDKLAYRNPKSVERVAAKFKRGDSVAERRSGTNNTVQNHFALPVNDPSFLDKKDVSVEDEFFHKFFLERARRDQIKGVVRHRTNVDSNEEIEEEEAEVKALDAVEKRDFDHGFEEFGVQDSSDDDDDDGGGEEQDSNDENLDKTFEDFEDEWEDDSDEEAFVNSLAEKIIEDSTQGDGFKKLDEEDPDMDGWGDLNDSDEDGKNGKENEDSDDGDDAFANDSNIDDDDSYEDSRVESKLCGEEDVDEALFVKDIAAFEEDQGVSDGTEDDDDDAFMEEDSDSENSAGLALEGEEEAVFARSSDDDDDEDEALLRDFASFEEESLEEESAPQKSNKKNETSTFAPATEYEEAINKSFNELKRSQKKQNNFKEMNTAGEENREKRRKRKKQRLM